MNVAELQEAFDRESKELEAFIAKVNQEIAFRQGRVMVLAELLKRASEDMEQKEGEHGDLEGKL